MPTSTTTDRRIKAPPKGLAILLMVGPSIVWCAEYIGSGEVILATRTGAVLGTSVIWAVVAGIFLKFWIGMSGARYTVCTGESMIDMFARMPGPKNWAVWIILVAQCATAAIAIGSIASAGGIFLHQLVPISPFLGGWLVTVFAVAVVWSGVFDQIKIVMTVLVAVTVLGVLYVAAQTFPGMVAIVEGFVPKAVGVPEWAVAQGASANPWREILPLVGWGAGGFASQVWYTYWVMGAGYGATAGRPYGEPADTEALKALSREDASRLKGWCRVVYTDATLAMLIGSFVTLGFLIAGAGILGATERLPEGPEVALVLSSIFGERWGETGAFLFILGGTTALISTQIGQLAGWPRLLADTFRICIPAFGRRLAWKTQFRLFLVVFFLANMVIVYTLGLRPVALVMLGAILDGLLLTPLQALGVGIGLYVVLPRLFNAEVRAILRPHWIFAVGLGLAFLVFAYFCVFQIPYIL